MNVWALAFRAVLNDEEIAVSCAWICSAEVSHPALNVRRNLAICECMAGRVAVCEREKPRFRGAYGFFVATIFPISRAFPVAYLTPGIAGDVNVYPGVPLGVLT